MDQNGDVDRLLAEYYLHNLPGYREEIRHRVSEAQKRRLIKDIMMERSQRQYELSHGVDRLGREVEGCG